MTIAESHSNPPVRQERQRGRGKSSWFGYAVFILLHAACLTVFFVDTTITALALCAACYVIHMFGITAGFHRYFSHRAFKTSRPFQFALACLGCSASQGGPSWWVARHRHHHRTSDTADDLHSPIAHGFWWSHSGWILSSVSDGTDDQAVKDLKRFPELRWLDRYYWAPPLALAVACFLIGGWSGLVWGFLVSTVLSHHATFSVNSVCHLWGRRRFATGDGSRNNFLVALITLGEGWHNNHHHYQSSAKQGLRWWEIDVSYYAIRVLACMRFIWNVRMPPAGKMLTQQVSSEQIGEGQGP
jgi:stearoyl-CoA desaturase (delta-9 desaturase)